MANDTAPTPAGATPSGADPKTYRAVVRRDRDAGRLPRYRARTLLSVCDLAERQSRHLADIRQPVSFMGLGNLRPVLADPRVGDGDWYFVHEALEITGATAEQWHQLKDEEIAEAEAGEDGRTWPARVDEYTNHCADGSRHQVPVCNWQMVLMLALDGPWGDELMSNAQPALRRIMVETGLGDEFQAVRIGEDGTAQVTGESLTDVILAEGPLTSAEVAREQIRRGPLGALDPHSP